jgi:2-amino-4-hydroxy-6-hydroxymethyldihydropteridine diphosphokinase
MTLAYIGLGANLGDARATLQRAAHEIAHIPEIGEFTLSPLYRTAPVDSSGPDYINAAASLQTTLTAAQLLGALQRIELEHGRLRPYRNAPRTLDLDLLLFGGQIIEEPDLIVPHPRMHERAFVLKPLHDLAPTLCLAQGSLSDLLAACSGQAAMRLPPDGGDAARPR